MCRLVEQHAADSADALADRLIEEASRFAIGRADDRTLLVLKVR